MVNLQWIADGAELAKTRNQTDRAVCMWMSWRLARIQAAQPNDEIPPRLTQMSKSKLCKWLSLFVVEVHRQDSKHYPGATLHGILCGIQCRSLERFLTLSAIWSSTFWGMFLMHKWRICVCMNSGVVTYLGGGRKRSMRAWTSGQSECTTCHNYM